MYLCICIFWNVLVYLYVPSCINKYLHVFFNMEPYLTLVCICMYPFVFVCICVSVRNGMYWYIPVCKKCICMYLFVFLIQNFEHGILFYLELYLHVLHELFVSSCLNIVSDMQTGTLDHDARSGLRGGRRCPSQSRLPKSGPANYQSQLITESESDHSASLSWQAWAGSLEWFGFIRSLRAIKPLSRPVGQARRAWK
jgi:hypothetical protein